jgi:hypothetical protein
MGNPAIVLSEFAKVYYITSSEKSLIILTMKIYYRGRNKRLKRATETANQILSDPIFYEEIGRKERYDNSDLSGFEIAELIKNYSTSVRLKTYWAPTGANAKAKYSTYFKINLAFTGSRDRTLASLTKTLVHEYVHCVDRGTEPEGFQFTHVDNDNPDGEEDNTAPWFIGAIALSMAEEIIQ